jgi:hypothetical protein
MLSTVVPALSVVFLGLCVGSTHNLLVAREVASGGSAEWSLPLVLKFVQVFFASKLNVLVCVPYCLPASAIVSTGFQLLVLFYNADSGRDQHRLQPFVFVRNVCAIPRLWPAFG